MSFREIDRNAILEDERQQRLKKIKLLERENRENEPKWKEKQLLSFPSAIPLSNTPTLGQIISEETERGSKEPAIIYQRAQANLAKISDPKIAEYIMDRLDISDQYYVVNGFDGIMKTIREKYNQKINKEILIKLIKAESNKAITEIDKYPTDLTQQGKNRLQRAEDEADELTAKLEAERQKQEDDTKVFNDLLKKKDEDEVKNKATSKISNIVTKQKRNSLTQVNTLSEVVQDTDMDLAQALDDLKIAEDFLTDAISESNADPFDTAKEQVAIDAQQAVQEAEDKVKEKQDKYDKAVDLLQKASSKKSLVLQQDVKTQLAYTNPLNEDLKYSRLTERLTGKENKEYYKKAVDKFTRELAILPDDQIDDVVNTIATKYDKQFATIPPGLSYTEIILEFYKNRVFEILMDFEKTNNTQLPTTNPMFRYSILNSTKVDDLKALAKTHKISASGNKPNLIQRIMDFEFSNVYIGFGLKKQKRRKIVGRGASGEEPAPDVTRKEFNGKFIDLRKLKDNILTIKYCKTNAYVPTVKAQHISNDCKEVITDLINDRFDNRLFEKLPEADRRLVKRVIKAFSLDVGLKDNTEEEYRKQFDVILGQFQAGNNSPLIKNKLKQYVVESMDSGFLTKRQTWQILFELANA